MMIVTYNLSVICPLKSCNEKSSRKRCAAVSGENRQDIKAVKSCKKSVKMALLTPKP